MSLTQGNDRLRSRRTLVPIALVLALVVAIVWTSLENRRLPVIQLETPAGGISVEVANTPAARAAGLSNRDRLQGIDGLLLQWDAPGRHPIWMAEMRFPLDLVWLDPDGRVVAVLANVPPCRAAPCPLYEPEGTDRSVAVLEMTRAPQPAAESLSARSCVL